MGTRPGSCNSAGVGFTSFLSPPSFFHLVRRGADRAFSAADFLLRSLSQDAGVVGAVSMGGLRSKTESIWRDLPAEILAENVLRFLPIASLCRFKTVCKEWNRIISHPDFASRQARTSSSDDDALISMEFVPPFSSAGGWHVLDMANDRFYTLSEDFLAKFVKQKGIVPLESPDHHPNRRIFLAADGGLTCFLYRLDNGTPALVVCNPVLKIAKQLPCAPGTEETYENVEMATDRVSMEYEIFVYDVHFLRIQPNALHIYESKTGEWRTVAATVPPVGQYGYFLGRSVKLDHGFCKIFRNSFYGCLKVVFLDKYSCQARELGFNLPGRFQYWTELVVCKDRVFFVLALPKVRSLEIFEVILSEKRCIRLTDMPRELLNWVVGDDLWNSCDSDRAMLLYHKPVMSIGRATSILMCSSLGRCVAYDLLDRSWNLLRNSQIFHPRARSRFGGFARRPVKLFGSNNCLSFCSP